MVLMYLNQNGGSNLIILVQRLNISTHLHFEGNVGSLLAWADMEIGAAWLLLIPARAAFNDKKVNYT